MKIDELLTRARCWLARLTDCRLGDHPGTTAYERVPELLAPASRLVARCPACGFSGPGLSPYAEPANSGARVNAR